MKNSEQEARRARAAARATMPIRKYELGKEPEDNLLATTSGEERLAMVWPITLDTWSLAGLEIPNYSRQEMPVRVVRRAEH